MAKKDEDKRSGGFAGFGGHTNSSGERVSALRDMFDGGGRGRAGASFEGSPISTFGNAAGIRPSGSSVANPRRAIGFGDFTDGGGYGRSGSSFQGSPYSTMANAFGIRPMGSSVPNPRQGAFSRDFMDGGGFGQTGNAFAVSPMSMLANALGIKPLGSEQPQPAPQAPQAPQAGTGFGTDYSDMLMSQMGLGQNPYGITPEDALPLTSMSTPSEIDDFYNTSSTTPSGAGVIVDDGGFDNYVAGLGGAAEGMTPEALRYAYRLYQQGYTN